MQTRRILIVVFIMSFCFTANAQFEIPKFTSNATKKDSLENDVFLEQSQNCDFVIAIKSKGFWLRERKMYFLAVQKNKLKAIVLTTDIRDKDGNILSGKFNIKRYRISNRRYRKIFQQLMLNRLFSLNQDSLLIYKDTKGRNSFMTDGTTNFISIKTKSSWKIIWAYAPEHFLELIPEINERRYFINCKNIIYSAFKKKDFGKKRKPKKRLMKQ